MQLNYELPQYWYHGTNKYFDTFTLENMGTNWDQSILGVYFTQYADDGIFGSTAKEYAEYVVSVYGGTPYVYKCKLNIQNPLMLDSSGWYSSNSYIDQNRSDIKRWMKGEDCAISYNLENRKKDGLEFGDYILATKNLNMIEIISVSELKN